MKLIEIFNDLCEEQGEQSYLIDLEEIRNHTRVIAKRQVIKMVDMAKAQALVCLGEHEAAIRLMKRYL